MGRGARGGCSALSRRRPRQRLGALNAQRATALEVAIATCSLPLARSLWQRASEAGYRVLLALLAYISPLPSPRAHFRSTQAPPSTHC